MVVVVAVGGGLAGGLGSGQSRGPGCPVPRHHQEPSTLSLEANEVVVKVTEGLGGWMVVVLLLGGGGFVWY